MALICVPIRATGLPELKKMMRAAEKRADVIEVWVDSLKVPVKRGPLSQIGATDILKLSRKPLIIVNKGKKELGSFRGSGKAGIKILATYAKAGASYIDTSIGTARPLLLPLLKSKNKKTKIILSYHDFKKTPSFKSLQKIRDKGFALGADIVKIATKANKMEDNMNVLNLLVDSVKRKKPCIAFCMGKKGLVSRVLASKYGSYIIYLAPDAGHRTAPGQLTMDEYAKISLQMNI